MIVNIVICLYYFCFTYYFLQSFDIISIKHNHKDQTFNSQEHYFETKTASTIRNNQMVQFQSFQIAGFVIEYCAGSSL